MCEDITRIVAITLSDEHEPPGEIVRLARTEPDRWREVVLLAGAKAACGMATGFWQLVKELCFCEPGDPVVELANDWGAQIATQALIEIAALSKVSPANQAKLT